MSAIRARDRDAVLQALRAGVVPRTGQHLIQVGRVKEIGSMLQDVHRITDGGSTFRIVIGEYGAGKTFFLNLVRSIAMEKKLVTVHADLTPDRRLHATGGQARSLFAELMKNMSTRTKPDGGALPGVVEKFVAQAKAEARSQNRSSEEVIHDQLEHLAEMVNGYDFAAVLAAYCRGFEEGDEQKKNDAIRWLRGEFSTRTEARAALGVRTIVDDSNFYDQLKLMARFVRLAGFSGLMVCLDELVNLYKLANTQARNANYEQILRILNDSLQGSAEGIGFVMGGTPELLMDTRRGLFSYPALQSRLAENSFARDGLVDFSGPVLRLSSLTAEEFFVLLQKLRDVHAFGDPARQLFPDDALPIFMGHCANRLGDAYFRTPRTTIMSFINLLAVLEQNPDADWRVLLDEVDIERDMGGLADLAVSSASDDEFTSFRL
jgi:hypothetical protein